MNASKSLLALLILAAPCLAQGAGPTEAWTGLAPAAGPTTAAYSLGAARPSFDPWGLPGSDLRLAGTGSLALAPALRAEAEPEWLSIAAVPIAPLRQPVRREALDGAHAVAFEDLPGGIVLGLVAQPAFPLAEPRLRAATGPGAAIDRLELVDGERVYPLPAADPELLRVCLAFAASARADQAAVDLRSSGVVDLAPELVDTAVGLALIESDGLPHLLRPDRRGMKSLIVDRAARLVLDAATGEVRPEAELELRFYPYAAARTPARFAEAGPVQGALRTELAECERIAAWVAFFRWALVADPEGVARLQAAQVPADLGLRAMLTPRRLGPRFAASTPASGGVADWMRAYRESGRN